MNLRVVKGTAAGAAVAPAETAAPGFWTRLWRKLRGRCVECGAPRDNRIELPNGRVFHEPGCAHERARRGLAAHIVNLTERRRVARR